MKNSGLLTILASTLCTSGISNNIWNLNYEDLDNTSSKVIQTEEEKARRLQNAEDKRIRKQLKRVKK